MVVYNLLLMNHYEQELVPPPFNIGAGFMLANEHIN
jgi:hypothetical protein